MDAEAIAILGDTIGFKPAGGAFADIKAYVDYGEGFRSAELAGFIAGEVVIELLKADVPDKPGRNERLMLSRIPGKVFAPINVEHGSSGTHWRFGVQSV